MRRSSPCPSTATVGSTAKTTSLSTSVSTIAPPKRRVAQRKVLRVDHGIVGELTNPLYA